MEFIGKILLREVLFLKNFTDTLCYSERKFKFSFLLFRNSREALSEQFIMYHTPSGYISNVTLSMSVITFLSIVTFPDFCNLSRTLSKVCKSIT